MDKSEPSYVVGRNAKWCGLFEKLFGNSSKRSYHAAHKQLLYNSAIPFLGNVRKKIENMHPHKNFYVNIHGSIIHNSKEVEITQMSTNW